MTKFVKGLLALALFGAILVIAPQLMHEQGYILISLGNWTLEASVVQFSIALIIVGALLYGVYLVIRYLVFVIVMPSKWWQSRYAKTHANYFQTGIDYMALGQWQSASEQFVKVTRTDRKQTAAELALVCAARANNPSLSNELSQQLKQNFEQSDTNQQFAHLLILVQQQQFSEALLLLNKINLPVLKQTVAFQQLWLVIQLNNHQWSEVNKYLSKIQKQALKQPQHSVKEWHQQLFSAFHLAFVDFITEHSFNQLQQAWQQFSKANQHIPQVSEAYIGAIASQGVSQHIETIICDLMAQHGNQWVLNNVRRCYQLTGKVHMDKLFTLVQKQLNKHQDDKVLLTIFAYLSAGQKDNQLAKQALEQVIYSNNNRQDTSLYANVLAELGEVRHSVEVYQTLN